MSTRMILAIALTILSYSVKAQTSPYAGIWQDSTFPNKYYSIQVNADKMVFVDLPGLEKSGKTQLSSFYGPLILPSSAIDIVNGPMASARLHVLSENPGFSPEIFLTFDPAYENEAIIRWTCPTAATACITSVQFIKRIF